MITALECKKAIRPFLSDKRYEHCVNVSKTAIKLAKKYGGDIYKAEIAGVLHDITKELPPDEQLKIINKFGIVITDTEFLNEKLWHAISGSVYIEHELYVQDEEILNAVRYHTSGRKDMSLLEKIIFIADFISKDRDYPGVEKMRKLANKSLELAMIEGIEFTVNELMGLRNMVAPQTIDAYNDALLTVNKK